MGLLGLMELCVSSVIHLFAGFYIFSTAVAMDLSQIILGSFKKSSATGNPILQPEDEDSGRSRPLDGSVPPIVLIHGLFGFGKGKLGRFSYFGGAENNDENILVPDLGSLTSMHDRARELFYYLKGGQVDYGEEHSETYGHSRFGKVYDQGHYPLWDEHHPVHFVGHSAGAQVARVLQQMLHDKAFEGHDDTSEDWVLSVTALAGALNGTTRTYLEGMMPDDGMSMRSICMLQILRLGVLVYDWLDIAWLKSYYNFGFDHFEMGWKKAGVHGLFDSIQGSSGPFASGDWILPDLTIQGAIRMNSSLRTFPNTFYFSYATKATTKLMGFTIPSTVFGIHPLFFLRVLQMSRWRHPSDAPAPYKWYRDEDWKDNDGALSTNWMTHPRLPMEHPSQIVQDDSECHPMLPGIWYYKIVEGDHILYIFDRQRAGLKFDLLYDNIFERCRKHTRPRAITTLN